MSRPFLNSLQLVHCLPRFYAGRLFFVDSTYGSNSYRGNEAASPLKSIVYAESKCVDDEDDLIVVLNGYDNDATDALTNGDDTPIELEKNGMTVLFSGKNNFLTAIGSADSAIQINANQVTLGALPGGMVQVKEAGAGTTSSVVEIESGAIDAEIYGIHTYNTLGNYDEIITIAATAHRARIHDCWLIGDQTDTDEGIVIEGTADQVWIHDNLIDDCATGSGGIFSAAIHTHCRIEHNHVRTAVASKKGINFTANATGVIRYNTVYVAADANAIVNGNCEEYENYANDAFTTAGFIVPAAGSIT